MLSTTSALHDDLARSRATRPVAVPPPGTTPHELAAWLDTSMAAARRGDLVLSPPDPLVTTLYVETNGLVLNTDAWRLDAFGFGPPPDGHVSVDEVFDAVVGEEVGDVRDGFVLSGMDDVQRTVRRRYEDGGWDQAAPVADAVVNQVLDLVDRAVRLLRGPLLRLAVRQHEEPRLCVWEPGTEPTVHRW